MNHQTGLCEGCWRTLDEIAGWGLASETEKQEIWQKIHQRMHRGFESEGDQSSSAFDPDL